MKEQTIPVMANINPWNEAILRGQRDFKNIHFNWHYRGTILLYNSKAKTDEDAAAKYQIFDDQPRGVIVGSVDIVGTEENFGHGWAILLANPRRFASTIPYTPTRGSIRISRAPLALYERAAGRKS